MMSAWGNPRGNGFQMAEHATREEEKAERERSFFAPCLDRSKLPIDPISVESRRPPEPDIFCAHHDDGPMAFELVELCDSDLAKLTSGLSKSGGGVGVLWASDPTSGIFQNKLGKTYVSDRAVDLLIYTDGMLVTPDDLILIKLQEFDFHAWAGTVSPRMVHGRKGLPGDCGLTRSPHSLRALRSTPPTCAPICPPIARSARTQWLS